MEELEKGEVWVSIDGERDYDVFESCIEWKNNKKQINVYFRLGTWIMYTK